MLKNGVMEMRLKRISAMVLTLAIMAGCVGMNAAASTYSSNERGTYSIYASGRFNMDVPANTTVKANSSFPLEVGEVVTIKAVYSPFSASVDFGLIAPDGYFYSLNANNGSFDESIEVNQRGYYTLAVRNNSSKTVNVSGYVNY